MPRILTGGSSGVLLDGPTLGDEGVLAGLGGRAGQTTLDGRADDGRPELSGQARRAEELALHEHCRGEWRVPVVGRRLLVLLCFN